MRWVFVFSNKEARAKDTFSRLYSLEVMSLVSLRWSSSGGGVGLEVCDVVKSLVTGFKVADHR